MISVVTVIWCILMLVSGSNSVVEIEFLSVFRAVFT